ncbi:hypothetical protein HTZ77_29890 [Nonomuraea sp. SMC257]|uniref:ROK family protein n=1 Tax=Nonomuraea montanisoli TaxID=2741721 RepID=A0A7Y6M6H6_9ACTN|nr:hypothetical protein [Nonomuraea montanisoli]NUW35611.1 hypothetical protein [Nonomuraea montanisoli]
MVALEGRNVKRSQKESMDADAPRLWEVEPLSRVTAVAALRVFHADASNPRPVGRPAKRYRFRSELGHVLGNDERIEAARVALKRAARASGIRLADVLAVGAGTIGLVDPRSGAVIQSPALPRWAGVNLKAALSRSDPDPCSSATTPTSAPWPSTGKEPPTTPATSCTCWPDTRSQWES